MSFFEKYFERFIRKKVKEHEFPFDPSSWEKMEAMLDTNPTTTPLHKSPGYITFMVFSILTILFSLYYSQSRTYLKAQNDINRNINAQYTDTNSPSNLDEFEISETVSSPLFIDFQAKEEFLRLGDWMNKLWNNTLSIQTKSKLANIPNSNDLSKFSKTIKSKVKEYQDYLSEEKVFVHLDRTYFQTGENVWFKVYVTDAITLLPSEKSNVVYVQLIDKTGRIEQTRSLVVKKGTAKGDFNLKYKEKGGKYKIRAFTNWQRNRNEYFERVIHIEKQTKDIDFSFQFDKSSYQAEDTVNVQLKLKNESSIKSGKNITYSVVVNDKKLISNTERLDKDGNANVSFKLPGAFANFEGILNVQLDGSKKRVVKIIPGGCKNIDLQFMPEGGDLIEGHEINTAFKAINQFGNSVDINGIIYNSKGKKVTTFTTYHAGMGGFSFIPKSNEEYYAVITGPDKIEHKYFLPEVLAVGYSLKIDSKKENDLSISALSPRDEKAVIVVRAAGEIVATETVELQQGWTEIDLKTNKWPIGINQITLFDQFYTPQSERLVFVNSNKLPSINIESDKKVYQPREKVSLNIKVKDADEKPVSGKFSLSVLNQGIIDFSLDKQGHILSYLLLESELKGEIENPNFYFNSADPKAEKALDYLMMTHGYCRFSWVELENNPQIALDYPGETSLVKGQVLDQANQPIANAIVQVANTPIRKSTDEEGYFMLANLDLSDAIQLNISAEGYPYNWHQVFMYYDDLKLGLNKYPSSIRDLTKYPEGVVPPMYPRTSRLVGLDKTVLEVHKTKEKETKLVLKDSGKTAEMVMIPAAYDTITKKVKTKTNQSKPIEIKPSTVSYKAKDWQLVKDKKLKHPNYKSPKGTYFKKPYKEQKTGKSYEVIKKSISTPATNRLKVIPAEYKTVERKELITPEHYETVVVEAEYKTLTKEVLVEEATENTPAVYNTITEEVLVKPASSEVQLIPAEYKVVEEKIETSPEKRISISRPAEYVTYKENVSEAEYNSYARKFKYGFYRARTFYAPKYQKKSKEKTADQRKTLHWESDIQLNENGEAKLEFFNGDELGTFVVNMQGITNSGKPGFGYTDLTSKIPVQLKAEFPTSMKVGDQFTLPVSISNNIEQTITGTLNLDVPEGFKVQSELLKKYSLEGLSTIEVPISFEVTKETSGDFLLGFNYDGFNSKKRAFINVHNNIHNVLTLGGNSVQNQYSLDGSLVKGKDLSLDLKIYPNEYAELKDLKDRWENQTNIGFEDEIASTELNLIALEVLSRTENESSPQLANFKNKLVQQIENLRSYKLDSGGYSWKNPKKASFKASALIYSTLYRASQFVSTDENERKQLLDWIVKNKSKQGVWKNRKKQSAEESSELSLFILKSLSYNMETYPLVVETIDKVYNTIVDSKDTYTKALLANVLLKNNDARGNDVLLSILDQQQSNGAWLGKSATIFNRTGRSLSLETTAMVLENINLSGTGLEYAERGINYLSQNQFLIDGYPNYTYLKIKEVVLNHLSYVSLSDQEFNLLINGKSVALEPIDVSQYSNHKISNLNEFLKEDKNIIELKFGESGLSHRIELRAKEPIELSSNSRIKMQLDFGDNKFEIGKPINEELVIENTTGKRIAHPILIFEIPGGLSCTDAYLEKVSKNEHVLKHEEKEGKLILFLNVIEENSTFSLPISFLPKMIGNYKGARFILESKDELLGFHSINDLIITN